MSVRFELGAHLRVVVDLSVEHDPHVVALVGQGLVAGGEVDDAQPAVGESGVCVGEESGVIGPAMGDHVAHGDGAAAIVGSERRGGDDTGDPAHWLHRLRERDGGRAVIRRRFVDEGPEPQLEHEQLPETVRMVASPGAVIVPEPLDFSRLEDAARLQPPVEQQV